MRKNIDIAYTLIDLCQTIENCYSNCGDDFYAFSNKQYCDEIALFSKTLHRINLLFECFTPEFRKRYSSEVIARLWKAIKAIQADNGFSIPLYWDSLKTDIIQLKTSMSSLVLDHKTFMQPWFVGDLHMVKFE